MLAGLTAVYSCKVKLYHLDTRVTVIFFTKYGNDLFYENYNLISSSTVNVIFLHITTVKYLQKYQINKHVFYSGLKCTYHAHCFTILFASYIYSYNHHGKLFFCNRISLILTNIVPLLLFLVLIKLDKWHWWRPPVHCQPCHQVFNVVVYMYTCNNVLSWYDLSRIWFWRYLTRGLIWRLSQSSIILVRLWNHIIK